MFRIAGFSTRRYKLGMNERFLGIDLGSKRIGCAISDPLNITAQPLPVIPFTSVDSLAQSLARLIEQYDVHRIVVGLPLNMNGSEGPAAQSARQIAHDLEKILNIEFIFRDERLSTREVERVLIEGNVRRNARRQRIDSLAAVLILQGFLDRLSLTGDSPKC